LKVDFGSKAREATTLCTELRLIHSGWGSSPEWKEARQWFEKGWGDAFEKLRKQIN
jgi:hypothetical protein